MKRIWKIILIASLIGNLAIVYVAIKALEYRAHINEFLYKYNNVVSEFSQRDIYEFENATFRSDNSVDNRIVFLGTQTVLAWPLEERFPNHEAVNRGVFGQRISGLLLRIYPDLIDLRPEYGVVEISSYNFRQESNVAEIIDYSKSMLQLLKAENISPIGCSIIPPCRDSVDLGEYNLIDSISAYNDWLRSYCETNNIMLADFNKVLSGNDSFLKIDFASGPIDLNHSGYEQISRLIDSLISMQQP